MINRNIIGVYNRQIESSIGSVVEEDGIDETRDRVTETEEAAEDDFDIRDLLLDETD